MRIAIGMGVGMQRLVALPILTDGSLIGDTLSFVTNEAGTAILTLVPAAEATPTKTQVANGLNAAGSPAVFSGSQLVTLGANNFAFTLPSITDGDYKFCLVVQAEGRISDVLVLVGEVDQTAPVFVSADVDAAGTTLTLGYDEILAGTASPSDYAVTADAVAQTISAVLVGEQEVTLTLSSAIQSAATVLVSYTGTTISDDAGNTAATFASQAVTNNSTQVAPTNVLVPDLAQLNDSALWSVTNQSTIPVTAGVLRFSGTQAAFTFRQSNTVWVDPIAPVSASTLYEFLIDVVDMTLGGDMRFQIYYRDSSGASIGTADSIPASTVSVTATGTYGPYTFTTPALCTNIAIRVTDIAGGRIMDFDNIVVRPV